MNNAQKFIDRNRPPRVQIKTGVDGDDEQERIEIPFVMGVMASLSGKSRKEKDDLRDRRFVECGTDDQLDTVMESMAPRVAFQVDDSEGDGKLNVDITFNNMGSFSPEKVAAKVEGIKELLELRNALATLAAHSDGKRTSTKWLNETLAQIRANAVAKAMPE